MAVLFKRDDGTFSSSRVDAHRVDPSDVLAVARSVSSRIPGQFFVGTAQHESNFTVNERDSGDQGDGTDSDGIFQLSRSEAVKAGHPAADLFDLGDSATVFAILMHRNLDRILAAQEQWTGTGIPGGPGDVWAYLSMSHNQGIGAVEESIKRYGLNYSGPNGYRERNKGIVKQGFNGPNIVAYCDDVISGGSAWRAEWNDLPPPDPDVDVADPFPRLALILVGAIALYAAWRYL